VLEQPPVVLFVPPGEGKLKRTGSLLELSPGPVRLLALKRAEDGKGYILRVQAAPGKAVKVTALWLGTKIVLGPLKGGEIGTWKLKSTNSGWNAVRVNANEAT
jgi:alpha-mannosidase